MVEMQYVNSSNVEQVGYDDDYLELHIKFLNSPVIYVYQAVPRQVFDDMLSAASIGSFVSRNISKVYTFEKR